MERSNRLDPIRVILIDDQVLFVESLKTLLATSYPDIQVVGSYYSAQGAIDEIHTVNPQVVVLDMRMPQISGAEACKLLLKEKPDLHVMILTTFDNDEYVLEALKAGAEGYLLKDVNPSFLVDAIRSISGGGVLMSPAVAQKVVSRVDQKESETEPDENDPFFQLSTKEREILRLVGAGLSNKEIAAEVFMAEQTVKNYLSSIYSRLGVHDRAHAILMLKEKYENR